MWGTAIRRPVATSFEAWVGLRFLRKWPSLGDRVAVMALQGSEECDLLRALVFWEKTNSEIEQRLAARPETTADFQRLALDLTGMTVPGEAARGAFGALADHIEALRRALQRPIGVRAAALDLVDQKEDHLREEGVVQELPHESLWRMAFVDHLTGLPNFRSLSDRFANEIRRATRYRRLLSLIMLDLDGFKEINDHFGHLVGNAALRHVGGMLRAFLRETDVMGRYGGDEFMVLLPETPKHNAESLAADIRELISASPLQLEGNEKLSLTASLGMASFPRDARTADALISEADCAMYSAKRAGRNQVCFSRPRTSARLSHGPFSTRVYTSVHVIGDFNGWDRTAEPMEWNPSTRCFSVELYLAPGQYEYKLLLDKERLSLDPDNPDKVYDGFDGQNSVLRVFPENDDVLPV
jgi:diguanylate cyclase (GGDEF)-like protein